MATAFEYVYLHGFLSNTTSLKGAVYRQKFASIGIDLHILDVKAGKGHSDTRVSLGLKALDDYYKSKNKPLRLIGSSIGGFISAVYSAQNPEHVDRVVLLNPAVNLEETWVTIASTEDSTRLARWKEDGKLDFRDFKTDEQLWIPFEYVEDSLQYPKFPNVPCPSIVFVGSKDIVIPPKNAYAFQLSQQDPDQMKIVDIDDDHIMLKEETLNRVIEEVSRFFALDENKTEKDCA